MQVATGSRVFILNKIIQVDHKEWYHDQIVLKHKFQNQNDHFYA